MRFAIVLTLLFLLDLYLFQAVKELTSHKSELVKSLWRVGYWVCTLASFLLIYLLSGRFELAWPEIWITYGRAAIFIFYFSKLVFLIFVFLDDLRRLAIWTSHQIVPDWKTEIGRSNTLLIAGLIIGLIPLTTLIYGMVRNPYRYTLHHEKVYFEALWGLPDLKIIHISDIHAGSLSSREGVMRAVETINSLEPDLVFFTGDLVNNYADEFLPFQSIFGEIKAKYGVYSVLGNHDYGDYVAWPSAEAKKANLERLIALQKEIGWEILLDENRFLDWFGSKIGIVGIQNCSGKQNMRFQSYGDLSKAMLGVDSCDIVLLLSHDPSFWKSSVLSYRPRIDMTFSGHTHGFQFGIEIPNWIKWSPVQYVYEHWAGLYTIGNQHLYVNRGFGFLGYPGRVGILPEITEIILTGNQDSSLPN